MAASFTPIQPTLGIAHGDLRLVCGCSAMETHFMKLPTNSSVLLLLPETVWNSVVSVAIEDTQFLSATCFNTRWSHSVSLCGLPLCGWAVVAPRCFHFALTALTVYRVCSFYGLTCSTANVCLYRLHGCVLDFIHLSASGLAELAKSTNLKGCPHTFLCILYSECTKH
jgi:hypothetical protein